MSPTADTEQFAFEVTPSHLSVADTAMSRPADNEAAAAAGKSTAVGLGPPGLPPIPNGAILIQRRIEARPIMRHDKNEEPVYRSIDHS